MKTCLKCHTNFPNTIKIDERIHNISNRKYCLNCSPFKLGNTKKLHLPNQEKNYIHSRKYKKLNKEDRDILNKKTYCYQKFQRIKRKIELVKLAGGCCVKCGYDKNLAVFNFHHRNPEEKLFTIDSRQLYAKSWEILLLELKKCDLYCANCHQELHNPEHSNWQNFNLELTHQEFLKGKHFNENL